MISTNPAPNFTEVVIAVPRERAARPKPRNGPPPVGWRRKGTALPARSPRQKAREDEVRLAFARGLKRDVWDLNLRLRNPDLDATTGAAALRDLVRRFVEFLVANETYCLRACWDNPHLRGTYRATAEMLVRQCQQTRGCDDYARVLKKEALYWVLCPHKITMDLEENEWVDHGAIRDAMWASMKRMRKWAEDDRCAKRPRLGPAPVVVPDGSVGARA